MTDNPNAAGFAADNEGGLLLTEVATVTVRAPPAIAPLSNEDCLWTALDMLDRCTIPAEKRVAIAKSLLEGTGHVVAKPE